MCAVVVNEDDEDGEGVDCDRSNIPGGDGGEGEGGVNAGID